MPTLDLDPQRSPLDRIRELADALDAEGDRSGTAFVREVGRAYRERLEDGDVLGALAAFARLRPYAASPSARRRAA